MLKTDHPVFNLATLDGGNVLVVIEFQVGGLMW